MAKIELRPYQNSLISDLRTSIIKGHRKIVLCAPTGSGKTIMFTYMVSEHIKKGGNVLILTHRKELLKQAGSSFELFGLKPEFIRAGKKSNLSAKLHVGMIETIHRREKDFISEKTLIIIDEAHISSFNKIFQYISTNTIVIGATATPYRKGTDAIGLDTFYTDIVQGVDTPDLIELGFLSSADSFGVKIDLSKAKKKGDDYDTSKLYSESRLYQGVVSNWQRLTPNKKTILFASNVKSSREVCKEFNDNGIEAMHIDGETPDNEREHALSWFENTDGAVLCNCGILTAGYNCPDIEVIILYRATTSLPLFLQMVGRGSRITPTKKKFTILDFGNNIHRLGFWQDPRTWTLKKVEQRKNDKQDASFIKMCHKCGAIVAPSTKICPHCGTELKKELKEELAELEKLSPREKYNQDLKTKAIMCKNGLMNGFAVLHSLTDIEQARDFIALMGYKPGFEQINRHRFKVFQQ
jgi:superfamily II DNA or RNA helicase